MKTHIGKDFYKMWGISSLEVAKTGVEEDLAETLQTDKLNRTELVWAEESGI